MGQFIMNDKEREQLKVFQLIQANFITRQEAAMRLGITKRWLRKKYKRFLQIGDEGVVHKSRGRSSNRAWRYSDQELLIKQMKGDWHDFGPKFASEKLKEQFNISVSRETVRSVLIKEKLWYPGKEGARHRKRRVRKYMKGEMIQFDGSPHLWFEDRGAKCTLLVAVDDATSEIMVLYFVESESLISVMNAMKKYFLSHGRPISLYVDYGSVFKVNTNNKENDKVTQFERMMMEADVRIIHARSPQAKGRVERMNRTLQDRLVKEMRLAKISSIEEANDFLISQDYIAKFNSTFSVKAAKQENIHRGIENIDLNNLFCIKAVRTVANDYTVSYQRRILQIENRQSTRVRPKDKVIIHQHLDGTLSVHTRKTTLRFTEIGLKPKQKISAIDYVNQEKNNDKDRIESRMKSALPAEEAINILSDLSKAQSEKRNFSLCL